MGKRGPAQTPTNLKLLRGNPGKRPINKDEPKPSAEGVRCPQWLSTRARKIWQRHVPELKRLGLMTRVDVDEFAKYCQFQADYIDATEWLQKNGTCYPMYDYLVDENGKRVKVFRYLMQAPQVAIARNAAAMASRIGAKFGLTPSDRSSLHVTQKEIKEGGLQGFLNRGKGFNTG